MLLLAIFSIRLSQRIPRRYALCSTKTIQGDQTRDANHLSKVIPLMVETSVGDNHSQGVSDKATAQPRR